MCDGSRSTSGPSPLHKLTGGKVQPPVDNVLLSATHSGKGVGVEEQFTSAAVGCRGLLMKALEVLSSHTGMILR